MKYKAVIFDFDDTLVSSRRAKWAQHKALAKKHYDLDLSDEDIRAHWGKPINELARALYRGADSVENIMGLLFSTRPDFMKTPFPEASGVVSMLLDRGIKVGIVSASTQKFIKEDLNSFGFPIDRFFAVHGFEETVAHKPDGAVFDNILSILASNGIKREETVYVGDSLDDFLAAHSAGIGFIALIQGLYTRAEFETAGATQILSSIAEVPDFVL